MIEDKNIVVIRSIKDYLDNNISDNDFNEVGATICDNKNDVFLNADIILKNSNFDFRKNFIESIVIQTNHLRKNFKYETDYQKRIEVITVLILSVLLGST